MILVIVDNRTTTSNSWLNYIDFLHLCPAYLLAASPATTNGSVSPLPSPLLSFPSLSSSPPSKTSSNVGPSEDNKTVVAIVTTTAARTAPFSPTTTRQEPYLQPQYFLLSKTSLLDETADHYGWCFNYDYNFFYFENYNYKKFFSKTSSLVGRLPRWPIVLVSATFEPLSDTCAAFTRLWADLQPE